MLAWEWNGIEIEGDFVYFIMSRSAPNHYLSEASLVRRRWTKDPQLAIAFPSERTTARFIKKFFKDSKDYTICGAEPEDM